MNKRLFSLFLILLLVLPIFYGCSANNPVDAGNNSATNMSAKAGVSDSELSKNENTPNLQVNALAGRKIIKTADLSFETKEFDKCIIELEKLALEFEGVVQNSEISSAGKMIKQDINEFKNATYTLRIPSKKLDLFLNKVGNIATLTNKKVSGNDITGEYIDTESRLKSLKIEQERLLAIKQNASSLSEILELEKRLTEVRTNIEQLTGSLQKMDALVELATVNVSVWEVTKIQSTTPKDFLGKMGAVFTASIGFVVDFVLATVLFFTGALPIIIALCPFAFIVYIIIKKFKKSSKAINHNDKEGC
jgi:hypothetical protein